MENSKTLIQDIEEFKNNTIVLSDKISQAGLEWKDKKYIELLKSIQNIAKDSKELIQKGENCKKSIKVFESYM